MKRGITFYPLFLEVANWSLPAAFARNARANPLHFVRMQRICRKFGDFEEERSNRIRDKKGACTELKIQVSEFSTLLLYSAGQKPADQYEGQPSKCNPSNQPIKPRKQGN